MLQSANLADYKVFFENSKEFHTLKREIWGTDNYFLDIDSFDNLEKPIIVDFGAYIGLSTLYFHYNYPNAEIYVFEPNPYAFEILMKNIKFNQLENVKAFNIAVGVEAGLKSFYLDNSDKRWFSTAGFRQGAWNGKQSSKSIEVEVSDFSKVLTEVLEGSGTKTLDLMKMDIEGSEKVILKNHSRELINVRNLIVEWHGDFNEVRMASFLRKGKHVIDRVVEEDGLFLIYSSKR